MTSATEENKTKRMDELYPRHAKALLNAKLQPTEYPTLGEMLQKQRYAKQKQEKKENANLSRTRARQTYFCIGVSLVWKEKPIQKTLKSLRDKYNLKWLRISISHHRFSNLREIFQGGLTTKLIQNVATKDCMDEIFNCHKSSKMNGLCAYSRNCRRKMLVYKCTCKEIGKFYIGQTQNGLKERISKHISETTRTIKEGVTKDTCTFAKFFSKHLPYQWEFLED